MILYALSCDSDNDHEFGSWFPSGDAFEVQRKRGLVACPFCGSAKVEKQSMAPRVARAGKPSNLPVPALPETAPAPQPVAPFSEKERELRAMVKALREHVEKNAEHVGGRFPDEARKMHYGDIEHRSIYGEATPGQARELLEEGIEIHPLPIVPDERN